MADSATTDIKERLKSAAELEPGKLPRLLGIVEETAEELTLALNRLSIEKVQVGFRSFEVGTGPDGEDPEQQSLLVMALTSRRFLKPAYLTAPKSLADACVTCFFGAAPSSAQSEREPTELDRALTREAFKAATAAFALAFHPIDDAGLKLGSFIASDDFEDNFSGPDAVRHLEMTFDIHPAPVKAAKKKQADEEAEPISSITIALPLSYLSLHRRALAKPKPEPQISPDETWSEAMIRNFEKSGLHLEAILARRKVPLSDIARLRVGQTIPLEVAVTQLITLECEGKPVFRSQIGFSRGSYVARFEETIDPTQEFIDGILSD